jgi:hypothetical protein
MHGFMTKLGQDQGRLQPSAVTMMGTTDAMQWRVMSLVYRVWSVQCTSVASVSLQAGPSYAPVGLKPIRVKPGPGHGQTAKCQGAAVALCNAAASSVDFGDAPRVLLDLSPPWHDSSCVEQSAHIDTS